MSESTSIKKNSEILADIDMEKKVHVIIQIIDHDKRFRPKDIHKAINAWELKKTIKEMIGKNDEFRIVFTQEGWKQWAIITRTGVRYARSRSTQ